MLSRVSLEQRILPSVQNGITVPARSIQRIRARQTGELLALFRLTQSGVPTLIPELQSVPRSGLTTSVSSALGSISQWAGVWYWQPKVLYTIMPSVVCSKLAARY